MKSTKNLLLLIVAVAIGVLTIFLHDAISRELFQNGSTWTRSQLVPYLLCWVSALNVIVFGISAFKKKVVGALVGATLASVIIGIDFRQHVIYQGDFSNNSVEIQSDYHQFKKGTLSVITIPGCPFCHASIEMLKILKERQPQLDIHFLVCSSDSLALEEYVEPIQGKFDLELFEDLKEIPKIGINGFPSFVYTDTNGKKLLWSNDGFGARARDFVESIGK